MKAIIPSPADGNRSSALIVFQMLGQTTGAHVAVGESIKIVTGVEETMVATS